MSGTLIVLTGPTGVGKTELSLQLAERYACPIVSADSRQFYGDIPIGTAAPTIEQLSRVEHYFVGQLALSDYYSASCYEEDVLKLLDKLFKTNDYVLLTGGSMLYIDAVCKGIDEIPTITDEIRREVAAHYEKVGLAALCEELKVLFAYFDGKMTLEEAVEKIKRNTRVYSKKQVTWYKKDLDMKWFSPDDKDGIIAYIDENSVL